MWRVAATVAALSCLLAAGAQAQSTAIIRGTVVSASDGAPVSGAVVQIPSLGVATQTDARGRFQLSGLPAGTHAVVARRVGLQEVTRSATVATGAVADLDFQLAEEALLIPTVVVSATQEVQRLSETAASVGVISGADLRETRPTHPAEIMSHVPGVWVNVTGGEGHMTAIRQPIGTKPLYLFLEDGVPIRSTGFFNHNALYEVNVPQAERIEVLKGPASALYGSDAIGGVVNVETRRPSATPSVETFAEGGAFGYQRLMASGSNTWGNHGIRADVNVTATDGWRKATGYDRQSMNFRWDAYPTSALTLRTILSGSRIDQQTAGSSALSREQFESDPKQNIAPISLRDVRTVRLSTSAEYLGVRTLVSVTPFVRWNEMKLLPNWSLTYDPTVYETGHSSVGVLARVRRDLEILPGQLIAGVDVDNSPGFHTENRIVTTREEGVFTRYTMGDLIYDYDVTFRSVSPYLQADFDFAEALHVSAGLRFDHLTYDYDSRLEPIQTGRWRRPANTGVSYDSFSPKLGLAYEFGQALNVYASYTRGFRAPSEGQLFRQGTAVNTVDLEPVSANSYEAGLRGELFGRLGYSLAAYSMTVSNDILNYTLEDGTPETQNAGETRHRGVEVGLNAILATGLRGDISYAYAKHDYERWSPRPDLSYAGKEMEAAPRSILNARLSYAPEVLRGSRLALEWNRLGAYWLNPENTHRYEGHDLFELQANVALRENLELVGRVTNLTDERYAELASYTAARGEELAPGMPRSGYVGLQYTWGR